MQSNPDLKPGLLYIGPICIAYKILIKKSQMKGLTIKS